MAGLAVATQADRAPDTGTHAAPQAAVGALSGYRILDLTSIIMGPYATQMLGDLGAEIICVEPLKGSGNRKLGPGIHKEFSGIALNLLRNKKSLSIDLKSDAGREAVLRIAATCDAVVTNMRVKSLRGIGLDYQAIRAVREDIVYLNAQGFRSDGDRADDPAYDDIIQAECGLADSFRRIDNEPRIAPTILADKVCGMAVAQALVVGLLHRERTGRGQRIEVPMLDVMKAFVLVEHGAGAISDPDSGAAGYNRVLNPERGPQRTLDGWINILPYSVPAYEAIFRLGGREDLIGDERLRGRGIITNAEFLYGVLREIVAQRTTADWMAFCSGNDIPVGEIADLDDMVRELPIAHHASAGPFRVIPSPILYSDTPARIEVHAPTIGQETGELLREAGYSSDEIDALAARGVVRLATAGTAAGQPPTIEEGKPT